MVIYYLDDSIDIFGICVQSKEQSMLRIYEDENISSKTLITINKMIDEAKIFLNTEKIEVR